MSKSGFRDSPARSRAGLRDIMLIILWVSGAVLSGTFTLSGCSPWLNLGRTSKRYSPLPAFSPYPVHDYPNYSAGRFKVPFLAEQLTAVLKISNAQKAPLLVLPIQELGRENTVSSFGLYLAEQLRTELYLNDFRILCPGQKAEGELLNQMVRTADFSLIVQSDPLMKKLISSGVRSIVYGSYQVAGDDIYLNVKMISLENLEVISIGTCELPRDKNILSLIRQRKVLEITAFFDHKDDRKDREEDKDKEKDADQEPFGFTVKGKDDF
ncbi:MAG: FlgO family outer membrane protein [bacterium]